MNLPVSPYGRAPACHARGARIESWWRLFFCISTMVYTAVHACKTQSYTQKLSPCLPARPAKLPGCSLLLKVDHDPSKGTLKWVKSLIFVCNILVRVFGLKKLFYYGGTVRIINWNVQPVHGDFKFRPWWKQGLVFKAWPRKTYFDLKT